MVGTRRGSILPDEAKNNEKPTQSSVGVGRNRRLEAVADEMKSSSRTRRSRGATPEPNQVSETESLTKVQTPKTPGRGRKPTKEAAEKCQLVVENAPRTRSRSPRIPSPSKQGPKGKLLDVGEKLTPSRAKRVSETEGTPVRKSRRLSGRIPEQVDSTPILPLKKRRTSIVESDPAEEAVKETELDNIMESELENQADKTTEASKLESKLKDEVVETDANKEHLDQTERKIDSTVVPSIVVTGESESDHKTEGETESKKESITEEAKEVKKVEKTAKDKEAEIFDKIQNLILLNKIPRQKPKSGKFWKDEKEQFRKIKKDRGQRRTFEERLRLKEEKLRNNEMANLLKQEKNNKKEELRKKIEENKKLKEQRQLKNEIYQVVKNPNKIKKMKKRDLVKRDILPKV